jgi:hypothetical protein
VSFGMLTGVAARVKWLASEWQLLAQSGPSRTGPLLGMGRKSGLGAFRSIDDPNSDIAG